MTQPILIIFFIFFGLALLILNKLRYDIIALLLLALCLLFKLVKYEDAYVGFMNPAVISVACIMVMTKAFIHSNVLYLFIEKTSKWMKSQVAHVALLVILTAIFSMFMNNVGALSLVLPIALKTAHKYNHSKSSLLMPIAFAAGLGGLCTSFGTPPNLIIANFRKDALGFSFSVFDYAPVGLTVTVLGLLFLIIIGWRLVDKKKEKEESVFSHQYICEIIVKKDSLLIGKTFDDLIKDPNFNYPIIAYMKMNEVIKNPSEILEENDQLILEINIADIDTLVHHFKTQFRLFNYGKKREYHLLEAVVGKKSKVIGHHLRDINLSSRFNFNIIGIRKTDEESPFEKNLVSAGDAVLIATKDKLLDKNIRNLELLPINFLDPVKEIGFKNFIPFIIFAAAILLNILRILPLHIALSFSVLLIILTKCLPTTLLYESINWPVIILLGAMIPIATSFQTSGGAEIISNLFVNVFCKCHPILILSLILLITILLSDLINNTATALIMAPIAIDVAKGVHLNIDTFLMAVAIGASCSFATPIGHQNNVIVYNLGKYKFTDYLKVGLPLEAVVFAVAIPSILYFWPIYG